MSSTYGENIRLSIFGQSHSRGIGVTIDGLPAGKTIDMEELGAFLARRAPGNSRYSTTRKEGDVPEFLSGLNEKGQTCGAPLSAVIFNTNTRSSDYSEIADKPRPGHADFTAQVKYGGAQDVRGGGHFSGRLTAPLCIAGGICLQLLREEGIRIGAHILSVHGKRDTAFDPVNIPDELLTALDGKAFPTIDDEAALAMQAEIEGARMSLNSVGGVIECAVTGLPVGLGDPMFDGMENRISRIVFGIPAVKGIEFGEGFGAAELFGSENNDSFYYDAEGNVHTRTNRHGGILGGITSGMPIVFRCAMKPTPSIAREQQTISLSAGEDALLSIKGRHDPCVVLRAVPCVIAAAAIAVYDAWLGYARPW